MRGSFLLATTVLIAACSVPSTLGLVCQENRHCDPGQFCMNEVCVEGMPPPPMMPPPMMPTTTGPTTGTTGADDSTTTTGATEETGRGSDEDSTTTGSTVLSSSSSGGPTCGAAVGFCDAVDVLFVVDNSESMGSITQSDSDLTKLLGQAIAGAAGVESLVGDACSYHVGVTSTEVGPSFLPDACEVRGALHLSNTLLGEPGCFPDDPDHPPFLTEADDLRSSLGCVLAVGESGDDDERQLETILAALDPSMTGEGGCNEGFLRDDAALIIILITDEDDDDDGTDRPGSSGGPEAWYDALAQLKPLPQLGFVGVMPTDPDGCEFTELAGAADGEGAEYATRLNLFTALFFRDQRPQHVLTANICPATVPLDLDEAVQLVADVCASTNEAMGL